MKETKTRLPLLLLLLWSSISLVASKGSFQNQSRTSLKRRHSNPHEVSKYKRWQRQATSAPDLSTGQPLTSLPGDSQSPASSFQCGCKKIDPEFQCKGDAFQNSMTVVVFLPYDPYFAFSVERILPALEIAVETRGERMQGWNVNLLPTDSNCSSITAPMKAFQLYMGNTMDLFLGPVCDYSLSPVAVYASQWNIPIISPGGFAYKFGQEREAAYNSLTRIGVTSESLSYIVQAHMEEYGWKKMKIIIDPDDHLTNFQRFCYLALSAVLQSFQENQISIKLDIHSLLNNTEYHRLLISEVGAEYADPAVRWHLANPVSIPV